ncbi:uncharacterized protein LMH87_007709 [Akanthomyces muscarius]|uniref:C2H2-type domain-containing protein n=1 Tax=Akanthomyces muscarius TaxID=2231603 RepID=A0A9W8QKQ2_AKAMU|nr:uncharacterized protein LMH87_007709 [Akanthomyces muscarius]KAJ4161684.1 hypothetical protein LMH87_007709 [Akanthomyces muscarius]
MYGNVFSVDVVRRAIRHKQTLRKEGQHHFSCEFCGKVQFNRKDNLDNHRKLHTRFIGNKCSVELIPAVVPTIEQEKRSREFRAES